MTRIAAALVLLILTGCNRWVQSYPPPPQADPIPVPDISGMLLEMDQPDLAEHIVKDVREHNESPWRWTGQEPTFNVQSLVIDHVKLAVHFTIWDGAFKQTGPLELEFLVNGNTLDRVRYDTPGFKYFEKAVPPEWLSVVDQSTIAIKVDKLYLDPTDGGKLGVIISNIGLVP